MIKLSRRKFVFGSIAGLGLFGGYLLSGMSNHRLKYIERVLRVRFGENIANMPAAKAFAKAQEAEFAEAIGNGLGQHLAFAFARYGLQSVAFGSRRVERAISASFLSNTNVFRVFHKIDDELIFYTIDPYETGCQNFLSAPYWDDTFSKDRGSNG